MTEPTLHTGKVYKNYKVAHAELKIPGSYMCGAQGNARDGIKSLKLTKHEGSLDRILDNGEIIHYVGKGVKPTPAHPVADQVPEDQELFRTSIARQNTFPVLRKGGPDGQVRLLGYYVCVELVERKTGGARPVRYYHAILKRVATTA